MLKIEFPAANKKLARAIGQALTEYGGGAVAQTLEVTGPDKIMVEDHAELMAGEAEAQAEKDFNSVVTEGVDSGKSAETATGQEGSTATQTSASAGANTSKPTHDEKGVMFIPAICGNAADPFYSTGPNKGRWKKRKGVDQVEYDRVYGEALAANVVNTDLHTPANTGTQTGRFDGTQENQANTVGQDVANSTAAETFAGQQQQASAQETFGAKADPLTETAQENPATPAEVFELYSQICQKGGAGVANAICEAAGIANGTLIFANPHLAPKLFSELTVQKAALVGG